VKVEITGGNTMHPNPRRIAPIILILALAILAYWYFGIYKSRAENGTLSASGTIEARLVRVSAELGGRVLEVLADEGSPVKAGDILVRFDTTLLAAQRTQAEATLNVAQANAEAAQANAKALQANAVAARANAQAAEANTQAAKANVTAVQALLTAAQAGQAAAQAGLDAAQANYDLLKTGPSAEQLHLAQTVIDKARIAADAAQEAYDALPEGLRDTTNGKTLKQQLDAANATVANAQAQYDLTKAGAQPGQLDAAQALVDGAQAQVDSAAAQVDSTQAKVDAAQSQADAAQALAEAAGSQAEALQSQAEAATAQAEAAKAQVEAARAALNILEVQINKMTLSAPADGRVLSRSIQPGEVAAAGAPLLMLGQLDDLTITVYFPEDRYGTISLGEMAQVSVDSFSGETFTAKVTYIADKAEFTPRNVQTAEGRRSTVFAVKLSIENPEGKLKPGMPADVKFGK
jgi:HlyD family secretion protein